MDGPSSYFFNLEWKSGQEKQMYALKDNNGHNTSDPVVMCKVAVDFYCNLLAVENSDEQCWRQLQQDFPVLTLEHKQSLETDLSYCCCYGTFLMTPTGLDGLLADFYKVFWNIIGNDYFKVLQNA